MPFNMPQRSGPADARATNRDAPLAMSFVRRAAGAAKIDAVLNVYAIRAACALDSAGQGHLVSLD